MYKLNLTRSLMTDPKCWSNFYQHVTVGNKVISSSISRANKELEKYSAEYIVVDAVEEIEWQDYVIFQSEADYLVFLLRWG